MFFYDLKNRSNKAKEAYAKSMLNFSGFIFLLTLVAVVFLIFGGIIWLLDLYPVNVELICYFGCVVLGTLFYGCLLKRKALNIIDNIEA
jgi:hypothetical protein